MKIHNIGASDFAVWTKSTIIVEPGDVIVAKFTQLDSTATSISAFKGPTQFGGRHSGEEKRPTSPIPQTKIMVKTKNSAGCILGAPSGDSRSKKHGYSSYNTKVFVATEKAPLIYTSTVGANGVLELDVRRASATAPSKQESPVTSVSPKEKAVTETTAVSKQEDDSLTKKLKALKDAKETGVLTEQEYKQKKDELLKDL